MLCFRAYTAIKLSKKHTQFYMLFQGQYGYTIGANLSRDEQLWATVNGQSEHVSDPPYTQPDYLGELDYNVHLAGELGAMPRPPPRHMATDNPVDLSSRHGNPKHNGDISTHAGLKRKSPPEFDHPHLAAYHNGLSRIQGESCSCAVISRCQQ